ncbi:MAG: DUF819 family protein [Rhodobacteraceae bacterium]|nr:DUF819 family protein [Paracoccaceae bacterium]
MIPDLLFGLIFVAVPLLLVLAAKRWRWAGLVGPVVLAYAAGILLGLSDVLPASADTIRTSITEASLALALPLLMFGIDLKAWRSLAAPALRGMAFAVLAVVLVATVLFFTTDGAVETRAQLTGLAIGMYTGGLANLGAVKLALEVPDSRYLMFATVDTVVGAFYLLFMLTLAPRIFRHWLPVAPIMTVIADTATNKTGGQKAMVDGLISFIAAVAIVGLSLILASLIPFGSPEVWIILLITTLGLVGGQIPLLGRNRMAEPLGMGLIYIFSFSVAAGLDLTGLSAVEPVILVFVIVATFGALLVQLLLCRLFRVDADSFMITSVAAIMSPAFVPMVVRSLGNPGMLMSGIAAGLIGFAIGNYLAISVALLLGAFGG